MRFMLFILNFLFNIWLVGAQPNQVVAENTPSIYGQLAVNTSPEVAWKAITENYGHVGNHHKGIKYAYTFNEQMPFYYGAVRHNQLSKTQYLKESITVYDVTNKRYTTTIYEASEQALPIVQQTVGIKSVNGQTYVYLEIGYKNATRQEVGKIKKWNRAYLKAYEEVIEELTSKAPKSKRFQLRLASMLYE